MARARRGPWAELRPRASARAGGGAISGAGWCMVGGVAREVVIEGRLGERCRLRVGRGFGVSREAALRTVRWLEASPAAEVGLRGLVFAAGAVDASRRDRGGLLRLVARLLEVGALEAELVAPARESGQRGQAVEAKDDDDGRDVPLVQTDWIGIELVDAEGAPVAWEPYVVELADGRQVRGRLGADGTAVVRGIPSGTCRITFPQRGAELWQRAQS